MKTDAIVNEQQLRATLRALADQRASLKALDEISVTQATVDPRLIRAQKTSIDALIAELEAKVRTYEMAKAGDPSVFELSDVSELGDKLIAARISKGWTQRQLGDRLGVKEQQIQRYEKERYRMASLERLSAVAGVLGLSLKGRVEYRAIEGNRRLSRLSDILLSTPASCFPLAEMNRRGWLPRAIDLRRSTEEEKLSYLWAFFERAGIQHKVPMLNHRTEGEINLDVSCALLAWQAQVRLLASRTQAATRYQGLNTDFLIHLARLSADDDGPVKAVRSLREMGVVIVFQAHLPKTLLDGAAMLLDDGRPCIGMTLRQDRLDNFWFVLFHEIGHILRHRNCGLVEGFLDEDDETHGESGDPREKEANEFARNALIPEEKWKSSFVRYARSKAQIYEFARSVGVGEEVVAGRLRHERKDFSLLSDMVGRGQVRKRLIEAKMMEDVG